MRQLTFWTFGIFLLFFGLSNCTDSQDDISLLVAKGGAKYGGEFSFMSPEKVTTLLPLASASIYTQRIGNQLFETLLRVDTEGGKIVSGLASKYTVNEDATKFTFHLRKGVYFHDDDCFEGGKGRELVAEDVKYAMDLACSKQLDNEIFWLLISKIKGAQKHYDNSKKGQPSKGVPGIKVVDKYTLEIELDHSFVGFYKLLVHCSLGVFPKEAIEKYGNEVGKHPVGTGPFQLQEWSEEQLVLKRNPNYWRKDAFGNRLPFLEKINVAYSKDKKEELIAFRNRKTDLVMHIPAEEIDHVIGSLEEAKAGKNVKHHIDSKPSLSTSYLGFDNTTKPFNDKNVRLAFNLGVDRDYLINNWLQGDGYPCENGFVPSMLEFNASKVKGYTFDATKAKQLLAQAGYPNGANFPTLIAYINTTKGSVVHKLALGVQAQLKKNLNVSITIQLCSISERDQAIKDGKAKIWRGGWIADYPDPENFLNLFYGKNIVANSVISNPFKYKSAAFDTSFEAAMREKEEGKRTELFVKCDQQVVDDAPILLLYHQDFMTMINSRVRNFDSNPTEIIDFSKIYIREKKVML